MSRSMYGSPAMRSGVRMGDTKMLDLMVAVLTNPFGVGHMGVTAENLVEKWKLTREEQDALAVESHRRAANAIKEGRFKSQIVPITIKTRKGDVVFDTDEHCKPDTTMETLAKMKAVFKKEGGSVTAGNASGINDGAAFFVLADAKTAKKQVISRSRVWCPMQLLVCLTTSWGKVRFRQLNLLSSVPASSWIKLM